MENILFNEKEKISFKKFDISRIIIYFAFYSFVGFCFESIFGIFSKGVLECRQSFLFGPFCAIYGIGAILMIYILRPLKNNNLPLFLGSCLVGAISEYAMSYICEIYFHFKWWDYSTSFLNINGRTCLFFAIIWGILGLLLINIINPKVDLIINKIKSKTPKKVFNFAVFGLTVFLFIDIAISGFALKYFYAKISADYNLPNSNYSAEKLSYLSDYDFLSEENILKIYPNLRIAGTHMNNTFVDSLYDNTKTYYIKFFNKKYPE